MTPTFAAIREMRDVDEATFRNEIVPRHEPVVIRGLVQAWPAVREGLSSAAALCAYLARFDSGRVADVLVGPSSIGGRFFYGEGVRGLNFERVKEPFAAAVARIMAQYDVQNPSTIAIQSAPIPDYLPGFDLENRTKLAPSSAIPRLWIGNGVVVQTHFDPSENIACVVAGRRRFTLFPPEQISNLYVGPLDFTPAGPPVSLASLDAPDFNAHPRFERALAAASTADLEPGDAIFLPYGWWHHVRSFDRFNMLVNYWWSGAEQSFGAPLDALVHALMSVRTLPAHQRRTWRAFFDHYVFNTESDAAEHIPADRRGVLARMTPSLFRQMKALLREKLSR